MATLIIAALLLYHYFSFSFLSFLPLRKARVLQSGTDIFPVNNFVHRTHRILLVRNIFKFLTVSCTLSLEVTIKPWATKVQGSNLTRTNFFQTVNILLQNNFGLLFVCLRFVGLVSRSKNRLFLL